MAFTLPNLAAATHPLQSAPETRDFDILVAALGLTGVVSGCAVTPQGAPNMTVHVAAGLVAVSGVQAAATVASDPVIGAADAALDRVDLVVVDGTTGVVSVTAGAAAALPTSPAIPAGKVVLATVYVAAAAASIVAGDITDKRCVIFPGATAQQMRDVASAATIVTPAGLKVAGVVGGPLFGDGTHGDVTIVGTVTLAENKQYDDLNVPVGTVLDCAGFRVCVRGALTGGGTIRSNGGNGAAATTAGTAAPAGWYGGGLIGGLGAAGAGGAGAGSSSNRGIGPNAGAGGAGASGAGGAAGTISQAGVSGVGVAVGSYDKIDPALLFFGRQWSTTAGTTALQGGPGGGAGGAGDGVNGPGGGGGGGIVGVFARDASGWTGTIEANGGNGGTPAGGNRGSGGGGSGGLAVLCTTIAPLAAHTIQALAGAKGAKTGTGVDGANGGAGTAFVAVIGDD
jgi:hypothetical protein